MSEQTTSPFTEPLKGTFPVYREIYDRFRLAILDGVLPSGARVPPAMELSRSLDVSVSTIQAALAPLVDEGLLERRQRLGTYVKNRVGALGGVGVYYDSSFWIGKEMEFYRALQNELNEEIRRQGGRPSVWIDVREKSEQSNPLPEILNAIHNRSIQGMILGLINDFDAKWLLQLPVPISIYGTPVHPCRTWIDMLQFFDLGLGELKRLGCKSVGMILSTPLKELEKITDEKNFNQTIEKKVKAYGLTTKSSWLYFPEMLPENGEFENYGYAMFKRLLNEQSCPDGLLVFPDVVARGVVTAILESNISVPAQLKLVFHRNEEAPFLNPLPTSWLTMNVSQIAKALVSQLQNQINGRHVSAVLIPSKLDPQ